MQEAYRTHAAGDLRRADIGQVVTLSGWVHRRRDLGAIQFFDLRDRSGLVQVTASVEKGTPDEAFSLATSLHSEDVVKVSGLIQSRENPNPNLATGEIEIQLQQIEILNRAETLPILVTDENVDEVLRLKYRYLDMRRPAMRDKFALRHKLVLAVRNYLDSIGFWEVETPLLWKSTPEGAREFLVPQRFAPGHFFVLPQSPQISKQLLMVCGVEKYFQIARCFRDEDLRADRQYEFTQIDLEMSFVTENDVKDVVRGIMESVFLAAGKEQPAWLELTYEEAMNRYGVDKPDTRYSCELFDATAALQGVEFNAFKNAEAIKGLVLPGAGGWSRSQVDALNEAAKKMRAKGVFTFAVESGGTLKSSVAKYLPPEVMVTLRGLAGANPGDLICLCADTWQVCCEALGVVRVAGAKALGLIQGPAQGDKWHLVWVYDFPLFEKDNETGLPSPMHHPFTMPREEHLEMLESDPFRVHGCLYDLVLNGVELGSGSIRCHRPDWQSRIFKTIGLAEEEAQQKFGFLLEAFRYGAPPHGGIALGMDRIAALMAGDESIREVIAFPKTASGQCPLSGAPTRVPPQALAEVHLSIWE